MATNNKYDMKVHTFGIGKDFDTKLVSETAKAGRGSYNYAYSNEDLSK